MILRNWFDSLKSVLTNIRALAVFILLYAVLLVTFYIFIATREATVWQVLITYVLLVIVPAVFFVYQAAIIEHAREGRFPWRQMGRDAIKFAIVMIPILLLGWAIWVLLNKWQAHFPAPRPTFPMAQTAAPPRQPIHWPTQLFATLRALLFGIALPLVTIQLWIEVAGQNLKTLFGGGAKSIGRRIGNALSRTVSADSVLTYAIGMILFFAIPYWVLLANISAKGTKTDFAIFITRLVLVFVFTLIGWVVTVAALTRMYRAPDPVAAPAQPVKDVPAEAAA